LGGTQDVNKLFLYPYCSFVFVISFDFCGAGSMVSVDSNGICWLRSSKDDLNVGLSKCGWWPLFVSLLKNWSAINLKSL
jgi:hypothetical protein